jgi:hypothetical protein
MYCIQIDVLSRSYFQGEDGYSTSTPLTHVINPTNDVMLATQMNGEALPPDHGYPVRVTLPGILPNRTSNNNFVRKITEVFFFFGVLIYVSL